MKVAERRFFVALKVFSLLFFVNSASNCADYSLLTINDGPVRLYNEIFVVKRCFRGLALPRTLTSPSASAIKTEEIDPLATIVPSRLTTNKPFLQLMVDMMFPAEIIYWVLKMAKADALDVIPAFLLRSRAALANFVAEAEVKLRMPNKSFKPCSLVFYLILPTTCEKEFPGPFWAYFEQLFPAAECHFMPQESLLALPAINHQITAVLSRDVPAAV